MVDRAIQTPASTKGSLELSYPYVHPLHVLSLARETNVRVVIPAALYFLSIYPHPTFNPVLNNRKDENGSLYKPRLFDEGQPIPLLPEATKITPQIMKNAILQLSSKDMLSGVRGSPNRVAYNNFPHGHESFHKTEDMNSQHEWS